jgi:hypothetical protein
MDSMLTKARHSLESKAWEENDCSVCCFLDLTILFIPLTVLQLTVKSSQTFLLFSATRHSLEWVRQSQAFKVVIRVLNRGGLFLGHRPWTRVLRRIFMHHDIHDGQMILMAHFWFRKWLAGRPCVPFFGRHPRLGRGLNWQWHNRNRIRGKSNRRMSLPIHLRGSLGVRYLDSSRSWTTDSLV